MFRTGYSYRLNSAVPGGNCSFSFVPMLIINCFCVELKLSIAVLFSPDFFKYYIYLILLLNTCVFKSVFKLRDISKV